jgi:DNA-binding MarR family transcriptional regulator
LEQREVIPTLACSCATVRRTGRVLTQLYDEILAPSGLRVTQFSLLATLARTGPVTLGELANGIVMDRTTLTRNLAPIERAGWVQTAAGADRRTRQVALTEAGRATLLAALPLWRAAQERVDQRFGRERAAALRAELATLTAVIR